MRSHNEITMTQGKGCVYGSSGKQNLNTNSSTNDELVGVNNALPQLTWTQYFLQSQGYAIRESLIYQVNQRNIILLNNARGSSS